MRLTYAGEKYLHAAERMLAANAELESQLREIRQEHAGRLQYMQTIQRLEEALVSREFGAARLADTLCQQVLIGVNRDILRDRTAQEQSMICWPHSAVSQAPRAMLGPHGMASPPSRFFAGVPTRCR